jgi:hypothetical protein
MSAKPKKKPRKVVVWAVVDCNGVKWRAYHERGSAAGEARYQNSCDIDDKPYRVVRCEGVVNV